MNIEEIVKSATYHTPVKSRSEVHFLNSTIDLLLPVPGGEKWVQLKRMIQADPGNPQNNEQAAAIRYFTGMINFISAAADEFEEEIFADDDEEFALAIGKTRFKIDRNRLVPPSVAEANLSNYVDMRIKT